MLRQLYKINDRYASKDYTVFMQAKYLRLVNVLLLVALPILLLINIFFLNGIQSLVQLPLVAMWLATLFNIRLLYKGHVGLAGLLLLWGSLLGLWFIMFADRAPVALERMDTIVFSFTVLSIASLLSLSSRYQLWTFHIVNLFVFANYCAFQHYYLGVSEQEVLDFAADGGVALAFFALINNAIYTVNTSAFKRIKEENAALIQTQLLLDRTVNAMPSLLVSMDESGKVIGWNDGASEVTGITKTDAMERSFLEVLSMLSPYKAEIETVIRGGEMFTEKKQTLSTLAGEQVYNIVTYPLMPGKQRGAVVRLDDVTNQAHFEDLMVQTEKMMSVGGLAAGMAHEINNPLAGILQNMQVLKNRFSPDLRKNVRAAESLNLSLPAMQQYMEDRQVDRLLNAIETAGRQATHVVANMLSFARKESGALETKNAAVIVEDTLSLALNDYYLKKSYDFRNIDISIDSGEGGVDIQCHVSMMQQVVLNLLRNAAQAMADARIDHPQIRIVIRTETDYAQIAISDNGPGIPAEQQKKIFEPFFTTKDPGVGTGLGLSVSFFIISDTHNGHLWVESEEGKGTTFFIRIPMMES